MSLRSLLLTCALHAGVGVLFIFDCAISYAESAAYAQSAATSSAISLTPQASSEAQSSASSESSYDVSAAFQVGDLSGLSGNILFSATIEERDRIFVLDLDGQRVRRVIDGPGNNTYPSWSPDGREFAFVSDREGLKKIFVARWDGARPRRVTTATDKNDSTIEDNPHWAAVGERIVFNAESSKDPATANLMVVSSHGGAAEALTRFQGRQTVPKFSADGRYISYSTNRFWPGWDVCIFGMRERRETCLLKGAQPYCRQDYAPDGKKLVYSFGPAEDVDLGILNLEDNKERTLTSLPGREYDAAWSPDGTVVAFVAEDGRKDVFNLYAITAKESTAGKKEKPRALVTSLHSIRFLSWTSAKTIDLEVERVREEENGTL